MAITTPVSGDSPVTVVVQNPSNVYSATPGSGSFVEVTLTGAMAGASLVQYSIEPAGATALSLDGTNTYQTVAGVDNPVVLTAKPNIYVKGGASVSVKVLSYQLGGQVST